MKKIVVLVLLTIAVVVGVYAKGMTVAGVFETSSKIDGFQEFEYDGWLGFPEEVGKAKMIIHENAEPRETVLELLSKLPTAALVYDDTDEWGKFSRVFLDKSTYDLLYVQIGLDENDTVLVLFRNGNRNAIDSFIKQIQRELAERED